MMIKQAMVLLAILVPTPALADLTVTYSGPYAAHTVEIASSGDVRSEIGRPDFYFITRAGHGYCIAGGRSRLIVMRIEDMTTVMAELAKSDPHSGDIADAPELKLVEKGTAVVNGRTGSAWYLDLGNGRLSTTPWVVISHDPALAPLGPVMAAQFDRMAAMGANRLRMMAEVLKTGAPLFYAGMELKTVSDAPIPAAHFELPVEPATLDAVRKQIMGPVPEP